MLRSIAFLAIILAQLMTSCKDQPPPVASVKDTTFAAALDSLTVCTCKDRACWERETASRSKESLKCARDSLGAAFPFVEVLAVLGESITAIVEAESNLKLAAAAFKEGSQVAGLIKDLGGECTAVIGEVSEGTLSLVAKAIGLADKGKRLKEMRERGDLDWREVGDFGKAGYEMGEKLVKTALKMDKLVVCVEAANKDKAVVATAKTTLEKAKELVTKTGKPLAQLSFVNKLDIASKLGKCGIAIFRGANALAQNGYCLYEDLQEVDLSTSTILKAAVGAEYATFIDGDPARRTAAENKGFACADRGDDGRDHVRRPSASYVSYAPAYENCYECCTDANAVDFVKGVTWVTHCVSSCNGQCRNKASQLECANGPDIPLPKPQNPVPQDLPQEETAKANTHCAAWAIQNVLTNRSGTCLSVLNEDHWAARHCENHYESDLGVLIDKPEKTSCIAFCESWLYACCLPSNDPKPEACFKQ